LQAACASARSVAAHAPLITDSTGVDTEEGQLE
jgi:hypothetical protein